MGFKEMKHIKLFEVYSKSFDRFDEYEDAKNSPEYKALIDFGFIDVTSDKQKQNGSFAFKTPLRNMTYGIYDTYYGRANIDFRGYGKNVPREKIGQPTALWRNDDLQSYEETFARLLKTEKKGKIGFFKFYYDKSKESHYIDKMIKTLKYPRNKAEILKMRFFPDIIKHPELEPVLRKVFTEGILKNPILYLPYYKYVEDGKLYEMSGRELISTKMNEVLSPDIVKWMQELSTEEMNKLNHKIVSQVSEDPMSWYDTKRWDVLPDVVKKELVWVGRGSKSGMWDLKTN